MEIGILTWFCGMNYGAQAQAYALQNTLKQMGHTCKIIAYYPDNYKYKNLKMSLNIEPKWYKHPRQILYSLRRMIQFKKFIKMHPTTVRINNISQVDSLNLDLIIIGSDEVVNCIHPFHTDAYFGVNIKKIPIMYYAPSSGALDEKYVVNDSIKNSLLRFIALAGRDKHTCQFLYNNTGRTAIQVLDPTMLYDFCEFVTKTTFENYILLYSFSSMTDYQDEIMHYAKEEGKIVISVGRYYKWADISLPYASVPEWVSLFANASIVITDSFHGLVFSIKYNKEFVLLGRNDKMNKNNDLLNELNISRTYWAKEQDISQYLKDNKIDYDSVNYILHTRIQESLEYIKKNLEKI